ncbi:MAG: hypothetical protein II306_06410 [Clostridia bacterium]|nr:hypothetical protein [Clostridia bacterium]
MTIIMPNMPEWFKENPPKILNCKYCGAEAEIKGKPDWEWWTHEIGCSKYCQGSTKNRTRLQRYEIKELVNRWNEINREGVTK